MTPRRNDRRLLFLHRAAPQLFRRTPLRHSRMSKTSLRSSVVQRTTHPSRSPKAMLLPMRRRADRMSASSAATVRASRNRQAPMLQLPKTRQRMKAENAPKTGSRSRVTTVDSNAVRTSAAVRSSRAGSHRLPMHISLKSSRLPPAIRAH